MDAWDCKVGQIKELIEENAAEDLSLSDISRRLGYSYFYTAKKFREIEGVSFREYLLSVKIQKAAAELYATKDRIIDIAFKYGYSSQEAFTRAFVRVFGVTPSSYRGAQKPTANSKKSGLLGANGETKPNLIEGGKDMKLYVKQMLDWNYYAFIAEDVEEKYWDVFKSDFWWQIGNSFIRSYDNIKDFEYCAENFTKYGEIAFKQQLKILPAPWEKALSLFIEEIKKTGADWYIHGSAAMALWGIDVKPKDLNIIVPNSSDFDRVRERLYKLAIRPIERCDDWGLSGGGQIFMEAGISVWHLNEPEPYDMSKLEKIEYKGEKIYISSLEMLKKDNDYFGRPERVKLIEDKMKAAES